MGLKFEYIARKLLLTCVTIFCLSMARKMDVHAADYSPVSELPRGADVGDYIKLTAEDGTYEVEPGDSLWNIAREMWGDGNQYPDLLEANRDILPNPDHILPGEVLAIPKHRYIRRSNTPDQSQADAYRIESADVEYDSYHMGWYVWVKQKSADSMRICSSVVTNRMGPNALTNDWEQFVAEVERCSEEICGGRVSDLAFEKYQMADGCDLCGYTFLFDNGESVQEIAVFYRLGAQNMAEIIGIRNQAEDAALTDATRYIAASFEDLGGKLTTGVVMWDDNQGAGDWNYPELHNVFTAAMWNYDLSAGKPERNLVGDHALTWEEPQMEQAVRSALVELWEMDDTEKAAFMDRPVMASDMAIIRSLACWKYSHADTTNEPVVTLICNQHWEEFTLERGNDFSFADLANFQAVEALELTNMPEYSFLSGMPHLKGLTITTGKPEENMDFLAYCKELRRLVVQENGFGRITEVPALAECKDLKYLSLNMPRLTDFSFLEECTQIRTFRIEGSIPRTEQPDGQSLQTPDLALLEGAQFIIFYDRTVRCEP